MSAVPQIAIAASRSVDFIYNEAGQLLNEQPGGPCFFISNALEQLSVPFRIVCAPQYDVEIIRTADDEHGRVRGEPKPLIIPFEKISEPFLIVSSLYDELQFDAAMKYTGSICLDVQGYVRARGSHGAKKMWAPPRELQEKLFVVKANELELQFLDSNFVASQKQRMLLVTRGRKGCELFVAGEKIELMPEHLVDAAHTVGAGDTLFGNFCGKLIGGEECVQALKDAMFRTEKFLVSLT